MSDEILKWNTWEKNLRQLPKQTPHEHFQILAKAKLADGEKLKASSAKEIKVSFKVDDSKPRGLFFPDPNGFPHNVYIAHSATLRALRADIFVGSLDGDELSYERPCLKCKTLLDWQFWFFCPICETHPETEGSLKY
jgi:hypothetical protein